MAQTFLSKAKETLSKAKMPSNRKVVAIVVAIFVAAVVIAGVGIDAYTRNVAEQEAQQAAEDYQDTLQAATYSMLSGGAAAEEACGMIHDVWYDTIYKDSDSETDQYTHTNNGWGSWNSDFNDSIANYMSSSDYAGLRNTMNSSRSSVDGYMKQLRNPTAEYEDAYDALSDLYDSYNELLELALSPTGSLTTFTSNFNDADSEFMSKYKKVQVYL